jgi:hypothetical protein
MTYEEKKNIADEYLWEQYQASWDTLSDTNSLHDCETIKDIESAAEERFLDDLKS